MAQSHPLRPKHVENVVLAVCDPDRISVCREAQAVDSEDRAAQDLGSEDHKPVDLENRSEIAIFSIFWVFR